MLLEFPVPTLKTVSVGGVSLNILALAANAAVERLKYPTCASSLAWSFSALVYTNQLPVPLVYLIMHTSGAEVNP